MLIDEWHRRKTRHTAATGAFKPVWSQGSACRNSGAAHVQRTCCFPSCPPLVDPRDRHDGRCTMDDGSAITTRASIEAQGCSGAADGCVARALARPRG